MYSCYIHYTIIEIIVIVYKYICMLYVYRQLHIGMYVYILTYVDNITVYCQNRYFNLDITLLQVMYGAMECCCMKHTHVGKYLILKLATKFV